MPPERTYANGMSSRMSETRHSGNSLSKTARSRSKMIHGRAPFASVRGPAEANSQVAAFMSKGSWWRYEYVRRETVVAQGSIITIAPPGRSYRDDRALGLSLIHISE